MRHDTTTSRKNVCHVTVGGLDVSLGSMDDSSGSLDVSLGSLDCLCFRQGSTRRIRNDEHVRHQCTNDRSIPDVISTGVKDAAYKLKDELFANETGNKEDACRRISKRCIRPLGQPKCESCQKFGLDCQPSRSGPISYNPLAVHHHHSNLQVKLSGCNSTMFLTLTTASQNNVSPDRALFRPRVASHMRCIVAQLLG